MESGAVDVDGLRIAYLRAGTGPPLVLLHGGMMRSAEWRHQLAGLSDAFTVVAWDAPGCGDSDDPPEHWGLGDFADCVAGFCAALGLERPHVAGLSFGGGLTLEVYRRHPELPRSLSLLAAYAGWRGSLPADEVAARLEQVQRAAADPVDPTAEDVLAFLAPDPPPALVAELVQLSRNPRAAAYRVTARAFAEADLRDVLPRITVPTLVLHGDSDQRCPLSVGRELAAAIPGAELVVLPGVGHMCDLEAPDLVNAELRRFLAGAR